MEYKYSDIEAHIRQAKQMRSEALGEILSVGFHKYCAVFQGSGNAPISEECCCSQVLARRLLLMSIQLSGAFMKTLFSLVNFVVGLLSVLIGVGNVLFQANNPAGAVAGSVAIVVGATFLWLATQAMLSRPKNN